MICLLQLVPSASTAVDVTVTSLLPAAPTASSVESTAIAAPVGPGPVTGAAGKLTHMKKGLFPTFLGW